MLKKILIGFLFALISAGAEADQVSDMTARVDSLFVIASSGELKYRDSVEPAKQALAELGAEAVPRLVDKLTTSDARERLTVIRILAKIGAPSLPHLRKSLVTLENPLQIKRICWALGDMGEVASAAIPELVATTAHPDWQSREYAVRALGKIGDTISQSYVIDALSDPIGQVRKSAAWSAGRLRAGENAKILVAALADSFYGVRLNAADALTLIGPEVAQDLMAFAASEDTRVGDLACETLGRACADSLESSVATFLFDALREGRPLRRASAAFALGECADSTAPTILQSLRLTESHPYVIQMIDEAVERIGERYAPPPSVDSASGE